jgi:hypothetical protein
LTAIAIAGEVKTAEEAISIGIKACSTEFDKGGTRSSDPRDWTAQFSGDRWIVSVPPDDRLVGLIVTVSNDGAPDNCLLWLKTNERKNRR